MKNMREMMEEEGFCRFLIRDNIVVDDNGILNFFLNDEAVIQDSDNCFQKKYIIPLFRTITYTLKK